MAIFIGMEMVMNMAVARERRFVFFDDMIKHVTNISKKEFTKERLAQVAYV